MNAINSVTHNIRLTFKNEIGVEVTRFLGKGTIGFVDRLGKRVSPVERAYISQLLAKHSSKPPMNDPAAIAIEVGTLQAAEVPIENATQVGDQIVQGHSIATSEPVSSNETSSEHMDCTPSLPN